MQSLVDQFSQKLSLLPTPNGLPNSQTFGANLSLVRVVFLPALVLLSCLALIWNVSTTDQLLPSSLRSVVKSHPKWLVATMSPYHSISRRAIIRATWQNLYQNESTTDFRFVLSRPDPLWEVVLEQENKTHGDLIILRNIEETALVSNRIKTVEFFSHLVDRENRWTFVSKVDDDSYLDAGSFYSEWLEPMILNSTEELQPGVPMVDGIVIGKGLRTSGKDFTYPSGQFYTLSWPMVDTMVAMYREHNITNEHEDVLVGELLDRSGRDYKLIELPWQEAFEIAWDGVIDIDGKRTAWANENVNLDSWFHPVGPKSINPHRMKDDSGYLLVAECFGPHGAQRPRPRAKKEPEVDDDDMDVTK